MNSNTTKQPQGKFWLIIVVIALVSWVLFALWYESDVGFHSGEQEFEEPPEIELHGRVLLPNGETVPGVHILISWTYLILPSGGTSSGTAASETDENGEYRFSVPDGSQLIVYCNDSNRNTSVQEFARPILDRTAKLPQEPNEYDLQLAHGTRLYGKVTYANGEPAPDKSISVAVTRTYIPPIKRWQRNKNHTSSVSHSVGFWPKTDAQGNYSVQLTPDSYTVSTNLSNDKHKVEISAGEKEKRFNFSIPITMKGRVVYDDGSPVFRASVRHQGHYPPKSAPAGYDLFSSSYSTDADGYFEYTMAPRWNRFEVRTRGNAETRTVIIENGSAFDRNETLTINLAHPVDVKFRLVSKATGQPLAEQLVELYTTEHRSASGWGGRSIEEKKTDAKGEVVFHKLDVGGEYRLIFNSGSFINSRIEVHVPISLEQPNLSFEQNGISIEFELL